MAPEAVKEKIVSFWEWFIEYEATIRDFFDEKAEVDKNVLIEAINDRILDFGLFSWEIGPGRSKDYYLSISPNGNPENLLLSKRIIAAAPDLPAWEFHPAKPPKDWDYQFSIYDDFMRRHEIDASGWAFRLRPGSDGRVDIILRAENIAFLDPDTQATAADLVVTNLLGEEAKINFVRRIDPHITSGQRSQETYHPLPHLRREMDKMY